MRQSFRRFAAFLVMFALLFAQAIVSAHACDAMKAGKAPASVAVSHAHGDDCCDPASPKRDAACDNHCQQGNQAPERVQVATVMPLIAGFTMPTPVAMPAAPTHLSAAPDLARGTQPPISIRNCCFRI